MAAPAELMPLYIQIAPEKIVDLKFLLESYDEIGIVRTLNEASGELVVLALSDTVEDVKAILESERENIPYRFIPPPETVASDWLLKEEF